MLADRRDGIAGVGFTALLLAQAVLLGEPPEPNAPAETIARWMAEHRSAGLASGYLVVAAVVLFVYFFLGFCRRLEGVGADRGLLAAARFTAFLNLASYVSLSPVELANFYLAPHANPDTARTLGAIVFVGGNLAAIPWGFSLLTIGWIGLRTPAAPQWLTVPALALGGIQFLVAGGFAQSGLFAPSGPIVMLGGIVFVYAWVLAASIHMIARPSPA